MGLPSREEIESKAHAIRFEEDVRRGLPVITSERSELSEGGYIRRAQRELMRHGSEAYMQQRKYLDEMAEEMGLVVMEKRNHRELTRRGENGTVKQHTRRAAEKSMIDLKFIEEKRKLKQQQKADREKSVFKGQLDLKDRISTKTLGPDLLKVPMIGLKGGVALPIMAATEPKPQPKARKARHKKVGKVNGNRNGRTSKKWNGKKVWVLSDAVWKVREPRWRRKRK